MRFGTDTTQDSKKVDFMDFLKNDYIKIYTLLRDFKISGIYIIVGQFEFFFIDEIMLTVLHDNRKYIKQEDGDMVIREDIIGKMFIEVDVDKISERSAKKLNKILAHYKMKFV